MNLQTPYKYELYKLPRQQMLEKTVAAMRQLIESAKERWEFVQFSRNLVKHHEGHDFLSEINTIFEYVRDRIRYVRDPFGIELVQSPMRTIQTGFGDCDDKTVLFCALCEAIGHRTRIVLEDTSGRSWTHVRADVFYKGKWIPADCTPETKWLGWQSKNVIRRGYPRAGLPSGVINYNGLDDLGFLKKIGKAFKKVGKVALKVAPVAANFIPGVGTAVGAGISAVSSAVGSGGGGGKDLATKCANPKNAKKKDCIAFKQQQDAIVEQQRKADEEKQLQMQLLARIAENQNAVGGNIDSKTLLLVGGGLAAVMLLKN